MSTALTTIEQNGAETALAPLTARDIRAQVNLIQEVMKEVMQGPTKENPAGVHFGLVPGCGDKPTLLQPGAHKLMMTFRLVPDPEMTIIPMAGGHREVRCKVKLFTQRGVFLGAGVGTCTTMEGKYRYRTGPVEFTDKPVPREYWDLRSTNPAKAKAMIGEGMVAKKNDAGAWVCARQGEKVEHDNPADYYNTVEKMAYKRALVSATLTVTAASDIFTQDIEDMPEVIAGAAVPPVQTAQAPSPATPQQGNGNGKAASVLDKMKPQTPPARTASSAAAPAAPPAPPETHAAGPVTGGAGSGGEMDAEWLSKVLDAEDFLRGTQQGKGSLRSIRAGFKLADGAYPMIPDDQNDYLSDLERTVERMKKA